MNRRDKFIFFLSLKPLTNNVFFEASIAARRRFDTLDFFELLFCFIEDDPEVSATKYLHHEIATWREKTFSNF